MNRRSEVAGSKKKSVVSEGGIMDAGLSSENKCRHCGGALKSTPDGSACMMCGRDKMHKCDHCLCGDTEVAA